MKTQNDQYRAGHNAAAYRTFDAAYKHMLMTGDILTAGGGRTSASARDGFDTALPVGQVL